MTPGTEKKTQKDRTRFQNGNASDLYIAGTLAGRHITAPVFVGMIEDFGRLLMQ